MSNDFIGYLEGYICTTDVDSHGDRITPEAIISIKERIIKKPGLRIIYLQHDTSQPCGKILKLRIDTKGKWKGLWAKTGIFKGREDVLKMCENKELTGFSIAGRILEYKPKIIRKKELKYRFQLEIDPQYWGEIKDILNKENIQREVYLRKALNLPAIISIVTNGLSIIDTLCKYIKSHKKNEQEINIKIVIKELKLNLNIVTPQEIKKYLKENQKDIK